MIQMRKMVKMSSQNTFQDVASIDFGCKVILGSKAL